MVAFIDEHKTHYGVEPICCALQVASSNICERKRSQIDPASYTPRKKHDAMLWKEIKRAWQGIRESTEPGKYGDNLVERALKWLGWTVERLMKYMGLSLKGVFHGLSVNLKLPGYFAYVFPFHEKALLISSIWVIVSILRFLPCSLLFP